jgi:hypothetical protein
MSHHGREFFMIRTILAALVLASAPALAIAECSRGHQQAMSCADGMIWDKDSKSCTSATG